MPPAVEAELSETCSSGLGFRVHTFGFRFYHLPRQQQDRNVTIGLFFGLGRAGRARAEEPPESQSGVARQHRRQPRFKLFVVANEVITRAGNARAVGNGSMCRTCSRAFALRLVSPRSAGARTCAMHPVVHTNFLPFPGLHDDAVLAQHLLHHGQIFGLLYNHKQNGYRPENRNTNPI